MYVNSLEKRKAQKKNRRVIAFSCSDDPDVRFSFLASSFGLQLSVSAGSILIKRSHYNHKMVKIPNLARLSVTIFVGCQQSEPTPNWTL